MRKARLDKAQAVIKIARKNSNNLRLLRYANDTTIMVKSKEELKSIFINVKEKSEKVGLKFSTQKSKITACSLITSWQIDAETMETMILCFLGLQNHCRW